MRSNIFNEVDLGESFLESSMSFKIDSVCLFSEEVSLALKIKHFISILI